MSGHRRAAATPSSKRRNAAVVVAILVLLVAAAIWFLRPTPSTPTATTAAPTQTPTPTPTPATGPCAAQTSGEFTPTRITVPGAFSNAPVLALPRDSRDVPSIPPVTETGKREVAWDRPPGTKPGSPTGNVLLNTHTWPDGTALGNQLLKGLQEGGRIIVRGANEVLCYRVQQRVEVTAKTLIPALYKTGGTPQLVIITCSGRRLGPADWTHRTLWYAVPESPEGSS